MTKLPCSPVEAAAGAVPRASRATRWRVRALLAVHALIAIHVGHWLATGRTLSPLEPSEAMEFAKHSIVNAGLVFFGLATLSTLVLGRFFCGWACHLVALQDLCRSLLLRLGIRPRPLRSRALAWVPLAAFAYMFLWPVAVRLRAGDALAVRGQALQTVDFWGTFPPWWGALITFAVCGFASVYFLGAKGFCTYGCPYGALFGAVDRLAPLRIRVTDACEGCGHCTATCSSNVDVAREVADYAMVVDPGCMKCLDCVSVCPTGALYYGWGQPALLARPRRERRRRASSLTFGEELALAGAFAASFLAFRGLYGVIPLLLALGLAGCVAAVMLAAWRVLRGQRVPLPGRRGAARGDERRAGRRWLAAAAGLALLVVHSGWVQLEGARAARHFAHLERARGDWFSARRAPLDDEERAHAAAVITHAERALAASFLPDARREVELAWARGLTGDGDAFAAHLERAIHFGARPAISHLELGNLRRAAGDLAAAARHYARALAIDPALDFAYPMLVEVLAALGRAAESEPALRRGVRALPRDVHLRALLADLYLRTEREEEAVRVLEEGVEAAPESAAALRVLAFGYLGLGRLDPAQEACRRAQALPDPDGETARLAQHIETLRRARR